ncbi:MAG: 30S ribosomal protein S17 [Rickettsia sp.]|nr:30S ribosomal protein S17 [Rickettsia sp.]
MAIQKLLGKVVKISSSKTIAVEVERVFSHEIYRKILRKKSKYLVHDAENIAKLGDSVYIVASRPISKLKKWSLLKIL